MDSQVRLLPALIGAAAVVVVLRLAAMSVGVEASLTGSGTASAADAAPAADTSAPAAAASPSTNATASEAASSTAASDKPAEAAPAESSAAGQAQNKGEADVLHALSDRRAELDARANDLALREQLLAATQKQVDDKIAELKQLQTKLDGMLAQRDDAQKAQLKALVKMYESMKPADAAKIFEKLDPRILVDVAGGMKPAKVGPVLAAMETSKAQELTALLANRLVLPQPQAQSQTQSQSQSQHADASGTPAMPDAMPIVGEPSAAQPAQAAPQPAG